MNSIFEDERVCLLSVLHPAYAHTRHADVAATIEKNRPIHVSHQIYDDYELVEAQDWLSNGDFKS